MNRRVAAIASLAFPIAALACNAIIGSRDLDYDPNAPNGSDGSAPTGDGAMQGDAAADGPPQACVANLQTDKNNCGACGFDCSNGNCANGLCTMVDQQFGASGITVDDTRVYVAVEDGHVVSCPKSGCSGGPTILITSEDLSPDRVRLQNGQLYFSNYYDSDTFPTGVYRTRPDKPDTPSRLTPVGQTLTGEFNLGPDASTIYWGNDDDPNKGWWDCTFGNCDAGTNLEPGSASYDSVFLPTGALVWSTDDGVHYCDSPPNCASSPIIYAEPMGWVSGIAFDTSTGISLLVFTVAHSSGTDKIVTCPALDKKCNPTNVQSGLNFPRGIVSGNGTIYYVENGTYELDDGGGSSDGKVSKCTLVSGGTCGPVTVIASGQMAPNRIAIDANAIYWTNEGKTNDFGTPGQIMKAPR